MVFLRLSIVASFCFPKGSGLGIFWDLLCGVSRVPHCIFLSRPNAFVDLCSESSPDPGLQDQLTRWNFQQMQEILVTSAFEIKRFQRMLWMSSGMRRWRSWRFIKISSDSSVPGVQTCNLAQRLSFPDSWWVMDLPGAPQTLRAPRAEDSGSSGSSGLAVKGPLFGDCVIYVDAALCLLTS